MKSITVSVRLLLAGVAFAWAGQTQAQPIVAAHYPAGAEGIKGASLPPPGVYFRDYNFFYFADTFADGPPAFDITAYINAPRLIWMTDLQITGANYGMDVIVPFGYTDWSIGAVGSSYSSGRYPDRTFAVVRHFKQFDLAAGYAIWLPTGRLQSGPPDLIATGFWSHMLTLGATWYPDQAKTWAVSLLNRCEICHEQEKTHIDPGGLHRRMGRQQKSPARIRRGRDRLLPTTGDQGLGTHRHGQARLQGGCRPGDQHALAETRVVHVPSLRV